MKTTKQGWTVAFGLAALVAGAADIAFVGTDGELSAPANWEGGSLPGEADVGVVGNVTALTVSEACAFGGLRLEGLSADATLTANAALTLGTDGLSSTSTSRTTVNGTLAISGAQTWSFTGPLTLNAKLSGTDDLVISAQSLIVTRAPEYDGALKTKAPLTYTGQGKIARTFESNHYGTEWEHSFYDFVSFDGTNTWRALFTDGTAKLNGWVRSFVSASSSTAAYPYLILEDGDTFTSNNRAFGFGSGTIEQRGGTVGNSNYYNLLIGTAQTGNKGFDVNYWLKGGMLKGRLFIGGAGSNLNKVKNAVGETASCTPTLIQDGGTVQGPVCVGGGENAHANSYSKYQLNGGRWEGVRISLGGTWKANQYSSTAQSGIFEMTGGTADGAAFYFGEPSTAEGTAKANDLHGVFDIKGGAIALSDGIKFGPWNSTATNATYRFSQSGGEIAFTGGDKTISAGIGIGGLGTGAAWSVASGATVTLDAPLAGSGRFTKRGAGTLALTDANLFSGDLTVESGEVVIKGGLRGPTTTATAFTAPDAFFEWTADDATATDDGAVATWPSVDGTKTIRPYAGAAAPKRIDNAVNGHAAIRYDGRSLLYLPKAESPFESVYASIAKPLYATVAVVFRTVKEGTGEYADATSVGLVSSRASNTLTANNVADMSLSYCSRGTIAATWTCVQQQRCRAWDLRPMQLHDGMPHVAIMRTTFKGRYDQDTDGDGTPDNYWDLNKTTLMVDGRLGATATLNFGYGFSERDTFIGALTETGLGGFTGEILAVAMCTNEVTDVQAKALSERYAERYGFTLETYLPYAARDVSANGVNPRSIAVAPGASLRVAYTSLPTTPWQPTALRRVSGAVTFDFSALAADVTRAMSGGGRLTLAQFPEGCEVAADAAWTLTGLTSGYALKYDAATRRLRLQRDGLYFIMR